jgi:hypothetical protein
MYILIERDPDSGHTLAIVGYTDSLDELIRAILTENLSRDRDILVGQQVHRLGDNSTQHEYIRCGNVNTDQELLAFAGKDQALVRLVEDYITRRAVAPPPTEPLLGMFVGSGSKGHMTPMVNDVKIHRPYSSFKETRSDAAARRLRVANMIEQRRLTHTTGTPGRTS